MSATTDEYFDGQWGDSDDPWDQVGRFSEQRKYDLTVAALPGGHYRRTFEPGCATGSLSQRLARRTSSLLASDRHRRAVAATTARCHELNNVVVECLTVPDDWPGGSFDLIVLSEILYYFDLPTLDRVVYQCQASLEPGGHLVACHYRPEVVDHAVLGDTVHQRIRDHGWRPIVEHREASFLLEVFDSP